MSLEKPLGKQEKLHVFLVEDSLKMRDALAMALESHVPRLQLTTASSSKEALKKLKDLASTRRLPHVVITDFRLTRFALNEEAEEDKEGGLKVTRFVKENHHNIPVIGMSSADEEESFKRAGASHFVSKHDEQFFEKLAEAIRIHFPQHVND